MHPDYLQSQHWGPILFLVLKLLAKFGLIPGGMASYWMARVIQRWRQKKALESWPAVEARIQWGKIERDGSSIWANITYSYYVGEYRSGEYLRKFRREEDADDFIRQIKDKKLQIRYNPADPDKSVILDRDLDLIALLAPQLS